MTTELTHNSQFGDRVSASGHEGTVALRVESNRHPDIVKLVVLWDKDKDKVPLVYQKYDLPLPNSQENK